MTALVRNWSQRAESILKLPCSAAQRHAGGPVQLAGTRESVPQRQPRSPVPTRTAATTFSPILNGCWTLAGGHGRIDPAQFVNVACEHMSAGLTTFDTADIYGPSESILGQFRQTWEGKKAAGAPAPEVRNRVWRRHPFAPSPPSSNPRTQHRTQQQNLKHRAPAYLRLVVAAGLHVVHHLRMLPDPLTMR